FESDPPVLSRSDRVDVFEDSIRPKFDRQPVVETAGQVVGVVTPIVDEQLHVCSGPVADDREYQFLLSYRGTISRPTYGEVFLQHSLITPADRADGRGTRRASRGSR